jgi:hypothetical protein
LQGVGAAAARSPEQFADMLEQSPRFRRAMDFAQHALRHSDLDVLQAVIAMLDPGRWLVRAGQARRPGRARGLAEVARALEQLNMWAPAQAMFRRIQADHVRLREAWPAAPKMATSEMLLHALRIAIIGRIWLLSTAIPEFSPRHGTSRGAGHSCGGVSGSARPLGRPGLRRAPRPQGGRILPTGARNDFAAACGAFRIAERNRHGGHPPSRRLRLMPEHHKKQKSFCFFFFRKRRRFFLFFSEEKNQKTFVSALVPRYGIWPDRGVLYIG